MNRAAAHEAGHVVIALHFGFDVLRIAMSDGLAHVSISDFDDPRKTPMERYVVLAGGIAAENLKFGNYDQQAMGADQKEISFRGGGPINDYLNGAVAILRAQEGTFERIIHELSLRWITARLEAQFTSEPDTYEILSGSELDGLWHGV